MAVAREYRQRGIPLSVIVADFFHWPHLGDWRFEPNEWPDPTAMVDELEAMGTTLMVSVWPSVSPLSDNGFVRGMITKDPGLDVRGSSQGGSTG